MPRPQLKYGEKYPSTYEGMQKIADMYRRGDVQGLIDEKSFGGGWGTKDLLDPRSYGLKGNNDLIAALLTTMFGLTGKSPKNITLKTSPYGKQAEELLKQLEET